eukprot:9579849-Alexandrium_andersonii.AAC.1
MMARPTCTACTPGAVPSPKHRHLVALRHLGAGSRGARGAKRVCRSAARRASIRACEHIQYPLWHT